MLSPWVLAGLTQNGHVTSTLYRRGWDSTCAYSTTEVGPTWLQSTIQAGFTGNANMEIHFNGLVQGCGISQTRTTRMPMFWGYPLPPHDFPYHWVILDPKSKDKVKVTNLKNLPKFQIFEFWNKLYTRHTFRLMKLLDRLCKYEMDPTSWRYRADTILSTHGQKDKVKPVYPPFNFVEAGGIKRYFTLAILYMYSVRHLGQHWFR